MLNRQDRVRAITYATSDHDLVVVLGLLGMIRASPLLQDISGLARSSLLWTLRALWRSNTAGSKRRFLLLIFTFFTAKRIFLCLGIEIRAILNATQRLAIMVTAWSMKGTVLNAHFALLSCNLGLGGKSLFAVGF